MPDSVHKAKGGRVDVAQPHPADEASTGSHAQAHGTLTTLLFHSARLEIKDPAIVLRPVGRRRQLFFDLLVVFGMHMVIDGRSEPVALRVVQHWRHTI